MSAVDIRRVQRQTAVLASCLSQPQAFRAALHQILEETSNRAYRAGRQLITAAPPNAYRTPLPVLRAISAALLQPASASPDLALATAEHLWSNPAFEEQLVAAQLVGLAAPGLPTAALQRIESWLPDLDNAPLADGLAREAFCPLVRLNPEHYLGLARDWAAAPQKWIRRFAAAALLPLAQDRNFENVPLLLNVLKEVIADREPAVRKALVLVLQALAPRTPAEVRGFLKEYARQAGQPAARVLKRFLPALSPSVSNPGQM